MENKNYLISEINSAKLLQTVVPLIQKYQFFYLHKNLENEKIINHFEQLIQQKILGFQLGAFNADHQAIGFTTIYYLPSSLSCDHYAYMSDLYVSSDYRGQGVGRELIQYALSKVKKEKGYNSLDWITQEDNRTAQKLYDGLKADKSLWYYYSLNQDLLKHE